MKAIVRVWCLLDRASVWWLNCSLTAPNLQPTANHERNDQCGNQHYSRELLMVGIVVPETFWAYKKYNKIISDICWFFYSSVITMMHGPANIIIIGILQSDTLVPVQLTWFLLTSCFSVAMWGSLLSRCQRSVPLCSLPPRPKGCTLVCKLR